MADTAKKEDLTARQDKAVRALLTAPSIRDAATVAGVGERTLWRWLQEEDFQAAYREARNLALRAAIGRVQSLLAEALGTLGAVMADVEAPASARVSAAKTVLDVGLRAHEQESLEARIQALETALSEQKPPRA
ncbi:MAG: hypothetical protein ACLFOY_19345 [Desulfatibacillaceae bacterium]